MTSFLRHDYAAAMPVISESCRYFMPPSAHDGAPCDYTNPLDQYRHYGTKIKIYIVISPISIA